MSTKTHGRAALTAAAGMVTGAAVLAGECAVPAPDAVFVRGDAAPSTGDGFQSFDRPNFGPNGFVGFAGQTDGENAADDVVYVGDRLVAREGDPAPGTKGGAFGVFEFFETGRQVNASGDMAFITNLRDVPAAENKALFREQTLIAREGTALDALPTRPVQELGFVGLLDDGRVGFFANVDGDPANDALVILGDEIILREGDVLEGLGASIEDNFDEIDWSGNGDLIVEVNTTLPSSMDFLVLRRTAATGAIEVLTGEGQSVGATGGDDFLELTLQCSIADSGMWAVRGNLGVAPPESDAIILTGHGFQVQQGEAIPELPGAVLGNFNGVDVNSAGQVLYLADIIGAADPNVDEGLFVDGCLLITDGVQAPGLPDGIPLTDIGFEQCRIDDDGRVVFTSAYIGGDGLFVLDPDADRPCPGDTGGAGGDGVVNLDDLLAVLANWGPCDEPPAPCPADVVPSGIVDLDDLLSVLANWGPCS